MTKISTGRKKKCSGQFLNARKVKLSFLELVKTDKESQSLDITEKFLRISIVCNQ
jgi:hypothetical protein